MKDIKEAIRHIQYLAKSPSYYKIARREAEAIQILIDYAEDVDIKDMIKYAKHIHKNNQQSNDRCAICEHDLRHSIHLREEE